MAFRSSRNRKNSIGAQSKPGYSLAGEDLPPSQNPVSETQPYLRPDVLGGLHEQLFALHS